MSRDQRPARVKMIGDGAPAPTRRADDAASASAGGEAALAVPPKSAFMLYAATFLISSMAGAAGMSLMPLLRAG